MPEGRKIAVEMTSFLRQTLLAVELVIKCNGANFADRGLLFGLFMSER